MLQDVQLVLDLCDVLVHAAFKVDLGPSLQLGETLLNSFSDLLREFKCGHTVLELVRCCIDIGAEHDLGLFRKHRLADDLRQQRVILLFEWVLERC